jgi:hypothetical protein
MTSQMAIWSMVKDAASNFSSASWPTVMMAAFLGAAGIVQVAAQTATDTEPGQTSGAPVITANPEHVTVTGGSGSIEIHWDTGTGSMGFVFVTGSDQKPVLFASGPKGSQLVPWIRSARYVFELYGDQNRRTLLATATVTGNVKTETTPQATLWRDGVRWLLIVVLVAIVYVALYLSSTGTLRIPAYDWNDRAPFHFSVPGGCPGTQSVY